ncbi:MAG: hypothetical protein INR71_14935 [Terriglobus roseus]|nr:hypothetical protein [Terriglobus roseus]
MESTADFKQYTIAPTPVYCREAMARILEDTGLVGREDVVREILGGFLSLQHRKDAAVRIDGEADGATSSSDLVALTSALPRDTYGPRWMSPVLRTWGLTNWDGDMG